MKKAIVIKMENMMVRDFNREESVEKNVRKEEKRLRERIGLEVLEEEWRERNLLDKLKNELKKEREMMEKKDEKDEMEKLKSELKKGREEEMGKLKNELNKVREEMEEMRGLEGDDMRKKMEKLKKELKKKEKGIGMLEKELKKKEKRIGKLEENLKKKEKGIGKLEENLKKKEKRIGELEEKWGKKVLGKEEWMELEEKIRVKREEMNKLWDKDEVERVMRGKVLRREKEFYGREIENSTLKRGMDEILRVLRVLREKCGLEIFVVSKYVNNVKGILCRNGCDDLKVVNFRGDWVEEILKETGRGRNEVILFSNEGEDVSMSEVWGIKVEGFDVREGKKEEFLKKIGIKKEKKEEKENRKRLN